MVNSCNMSKVYESVLYDTAPDLSTEVLKSVMSKCHSNKNIRRKLLETSPTYSLKESSPIT